MGRHGDDGGAAGDGVIWSDMRFFFIVFSVSIGFGQVFWQQVASVGTSMPKAVPQRGPEKLEARADGLFENGVRLLPRAGARSWAPVDVKAAAYDSRGRLWFCSPQGLGVRDGASWKLYAVEDQGGFALPQHPFRFNGLV